MRFSVYTKRALLRSEERFLFDLGNSRVILRKSLRVAGDGDELSFCVELKAPFECFAHYFMSAHLNP